MVPHARKKTLVNLDEKWHNDKNQALLLDNKEANKYLPHKKTRIVKYRGGISSWWLRSSGSKFDHTVYMDRDGIACTIGGGIPSEINAGVRPALWINLKKE